MDVNDILDTLLKLAPLAGAQGKGGQRRGIQEAGASLSYRCSCASDVACSANDPLSCIAGARQGVTGGCG